MKVDHRKEHQATGAAGHEGPVDHQGLGGELLLGLITGDSHTLSFYWCELHCPLWASSM